MKEKRTWINPEMNFHFFKIQFDYAVDLYEMSVIEERLGMTRETLVAMAMLVGCDYDEGIRDIGIEKAQELFRELRSNHKDPFTR